MPHEMKSSGKIKCEMEEMIQVYKYNGHEHVSVPQAFTESVPCSSCLFSIPIQSMMRLIEVKISCHWRSI